MNDKYLILLEQKYSNIPSNWSVEYFNQTYDQAFEKLVCLEKLKEDKDKVYYLVPCKHLWTHGLDVKEEVEKINSAQDKQERKYPFLD
jgi:hypothetical protein